MAGMSRQVQQLIDSAIEGSTVIATVTGTSGNLIFIKRSGQSASDAQAYPKNASYASPIAGDEVVLRRVGTGWVVDYKISR